MTRLTIICVNNRQIKGSSVFWKKAPKNFFELARVWGQWVCHTRTAEEQSFFGSFCSQKELLILPLMFE